jgi:hypothetical protein
MINVVKSVASVGIKMLLHSILLTFFHVVYLRHIKDLLKANTLLDYEDLIFLSHVDFTFFVPEDSRMARVIEGLDLFLVFGVP